MFKFCLRFGINKNFSKNIRSTDKGCAAQNQFFLFPGAPVHLFQSLNHRDQS